MNDLISQLVKNSFKNNVLDEQTVFEIARNLSKKNLRVYIKQLRKHISLHSVNVEIAYPVSQNTRKSLEETYKDKKINYNINKDLMLGIKITENDIIFSKNLKDTLSNIKNYLTE